MKIRKLRSQTIIDYHSIKQRESHMTRHQYYRSIGKEELELLYGCVVEQYDTTTDKYMLEYLADLLNILWEIKEESYE